MINSAGDLGVLIDFGDQQPGSGLKRIPITFSSVQYP